MAGATSKSPAPTLAIDGTGDRLALSGVLAMRTLGQARQALANVVTVLKAAGGKIEQLVRMTWYITDPDGYRANLKEIGRVYRDEVGRYYPAMSVVVVAGLLEPGARVEIEATAVIPSRS